MGAPQAKYTCKWCHHVFVNETRYLAHKCKQMKREEEFQSPNGQAAWHYYTMWLRQMKRMAPSSGTAFMTSKFFRTFMNFVDWSRSVDLPRPEKFIWFMVHKDFSPVMWASDPVYAMYLEFLDRQVPPLEQADLSIKTLFKYAEKHEIDVSEVFDHIKPGDLIQLIRCRRLSPWLLLCTRKLRGYLTEKVNTEQRIILDNLIRVDYWAEKMEQKPDEVKQIRVLTKEMGL